MIKKSRVFYEFCKYSLHAEQTCIMRCKNKKLLKDSTLILVKISKSKEEEKDESIKVQPCHMCQGMIEKYNIRRTICLSVIV